MTSHIRIPYVAPTSHLKDKPYRRYETVSIHGLAGKEHRNPFPPRIAIHDTARKNFFAYSCTVTVLPCTVPRTLTFETVTNRVDRGDAGPPSNIKRWENCATQDSSEMSLARSGCVRQMHIPRHQEGVYAKCGVLQPRTDEV